MKVLIVDDNSANRMTLKWVLSKVDSTEIQEADSGFAAISACEREQFDIIFMDVMMPGMTGIEATTEIKKIRPKSMVVAVTALDDDDTTREMFKAGAEDYITKPIKQDIFKARLKTYLKIIENRNFYSMSDESINLFDEPVYNKLIIFKITEEGVLTEFWINFLSGGNDASNELLCDTIGKIFSIGSILLKINIQFVIFCEENDKNYYFTLSKTKNINKTVIEETIKKGNFHGSYLLSDDRLSFCCEKSKTAKVAHISQQEEPKAVEQRSEAPSSVPAQLNVNPAIPIEVTQVEDLQIFSFIDEQDFMDLEDYIKELDSILMMMQSSTLENGDVESISYKIAKIASILSSYNETFELGSSLKSLAYDINENKEAFITSCSRLTSMFFSFTKDLLDWFHKLFKTGAPSLSFMDATIIANISMIASTIKPQEATQSADLDDIFF